MYSVKPVDRNTITQKFCMTLANFKCEKSNMQEHYVARLSVSNDVLWNNITGPLNAFKCNSHCMCKVAYYSHWCKVAVFLTFRKSMMSRKTRWRLHQSETRTARHCIKTGLNRF